MNFDLDTLARAQRYKLLVGLVVPRPIALVSTISAQGAVNAAPFSFFNVLADEPPIVIVSVEARTSGAFQGQMKDTARNIIETGEFVVNLVDESIAERMHGCSTDFPPGVSEIEQVGFSTAPSKAIKAPRIAEAPAALECTLHSRIDVDTRQLLIGRILWLHVRDGLVDPETLRVNMADYHPVGRLFADRYCRIGDQFTATGNSYLDQMNRMGRT